MFKKRIVIQTLILLCLIAQTTPTLHAHDLNTLLTQATNYRNEGNINGAIEAYEKAIELDPQHFDAHFHLGNLYFVANRTTEAIFIYKQSIALQPDAVQNRFNLALAYDSAHYTADAILTLEDAIRRAPNYTRAKMLLASIYLKTGDLNRAFTLYNSVLASAPNDIECLQKIASIQKDKHLHDDAITNYKKALTLQPNNQRMQLDLAYTYHLAGDLEHAIETYNNVLSATPDCMEARCNLAHMLRYIGVVQEALQNYEIGLKSMPDNQNLHYGYAETLLKAGMLAQGFKEFESRWKRDNDPRHFTQNLWDGVSNLRGKIVLLRAEYGHGDTLQFIRFAQTLKEMGASVIAEVQSPLVKLLSLCPFLDKVISVGNALPTFDLQIPVMSLPHKLNIKSEQQLITTIPYIHPDQTLVQHWKSETARDGNFKVGICWGSSEYYDSLRGPRSRKALHLNTLKTLAHIPNVTLYSLQVSDARQQIQDVDFEVREFGADFDTKHGGYMDTAALMKSLDLVITVDTSVAHLAGALGVPVWVVLPSVADWRWMLDRNDTPWYPTMKLFRQQTYGDWETVFNEIKNELTQQLHKRVKQSDIVTAEISIGELIDKITILQLKSKLMTDKEKLKNVMIELNTLCATRDACIPQCKELDELTQQLYDANQRLWNIEDACRNKERTKQFDDEFIQITRSVYVNNDERCAIKRKINNILGSRLIEEKSYAAY